MLPDIICFCHLRWNFVYQRPQHLLSRFAAMQRVYLIEDPVFDAPYDFNEISITSCGVCVVTPHLRRGLEHDEVVREQKRLLDILIDAENIDQYICWYYSPLSLQYSSHLKPQMTVYDCMDELSAFKFASPALAHYEKILFEKADIVFTGGHNLYNAKKHLHDNIYPFPSSIDKDHFAMARKIRSETSDQCSIPHPRIGFYGVIDERFDLHLLEEVARARRDWHFIVIGPVVKIDEADLPVKDNIHYLGAKDYKQLPSYLAGWDIAMMPFALNESTRYISPTKTPEFLAGGKQVISTSITDVLDPYGIMGLVHIADNAERFIEAAEQILSTNDNTEWLNKVDQFLSGNSWDNTWNKMNGLLIETLIRKRNGIKTKKEKQYV